MQRMDEKPPTATQFLFSLFGGNLSPRSSANGKDSSLSIPHIPSPDAISSALSSTYSKPSRISKESSFSESGTLDEFEPHMSGERSISETKLVPFRGESFKSYQSVTTPSFSLLPSVRFSIPRQLHIPLSFLSPEYLQISDTTSSELDLKLYVFPFSGRRAQTPRGLTRCVQSLCSTAAIKAAWDLSHGSQARCYTARRSFECRRPSILRPRHGWARDAFLRWCQTLTQNDPITCETLSTSLGTSCGSQH